jgi:hypothetical protein
MHDGLPHCSTKHRLRDLLEGRDEGSRQPKAGACRKREIEDNRAKRRVDPEARQHEGSIKSPVTRSASATQEQRIELFVIRC